MNCYLKTCARIHIHTHIHTQIHTHTHTCIRAHIHTHIYTLIHMHTCIRAHIHAYINTHTYTYMYTRAHTYTHTYINTHIYTNMHTCAHTHTHTNIHACMNTHNPVPSLPTRLSMLEMDCVISYPHVYHRFTEYGYCAGLEIASESRHIFETQQRLETKPEREKVNVLLPCVYIYECLYLRVYSQTLHTHNIHILQTKSGNVTH